MDIPTPRPDEDAQVYAGRIKRILLAQKGGKKRYVSRYYGTPRCLDAPLAPYGLGIFSPQQHFASDYYNPLNSLPGLIIYHDVGSGKTCTALRTLSNWMAQGVDDDALPFFIWVTKLQLKPSVKKDFWCTGNAARANRKLLVLSYEEFSNLVEGKTIKWRRAGFSGPRYKLFDIARDQPVTPKESSQAKDEKDTSKNYATLLNRGTWQWRPDTSHLPTGAIQDVLWNAIIVIDEVHLMFNPATLGRTAHDPWLIARVLDESRLWSGAPPNYPKKPARVLGLTATPVGTDPELVVRMLNLFLHPDKQLAIGQLDPTAIRLSLAGVVSRFSVQKDVDHFAVRSGKRIVRVVSKHTSESFAPFLRRSLDTEFRAFNNVTPKIKETLARDLRFRENYLSPDQQRSILPPELDPTKLAWRRAKFLHRVQEGRLPKAEALLAKIRELDLADLDRDGRTYKHLIFSDTGTWRGAGIPTLLAALSGYDWQVQVRKTVDEWEFRPAPLGGPADTQRARLLGPVAGQPRGILFLSNEAFFETAETPQYLAFGPTKRRTTGRSDVPEEEDIEQEDPSVNQTTHWRTDFAFPKRLPVAYSNWKDSGYENRLVNIRAERARRRLTARQQSMRNQSGQTGTMPSLFFVRPLSEDDAEHERDQRPFVDRGKDVPDDMLFDIVVLQTGKSAEEARTFIKEATWDNGRAKELLLLMEQQAVLVRRYEIHKKLERAKVNSILDRWNAPDNLFGEKARLLFLDSRYKEGIDVYDCVYFHMFEPPLSETDEIQATGRGIRRCGHQIPLWGLDRRKPRQWTINMYEYRLIGANLPYPAEGATELDKWQIPPPLDDWSEPLGPGESYDDTAVFMDDDDLSGSRLARILVHGEPDTDSLDTLRSLLSDIVPVDRPLSLERDNKRSVPLDTGYRWTARHERQIYTVRPQPPFHLYEADTPDLPWKDIRAFWVLMDGVPVSAPQIAKPIMRLKQIGRTLGGIGGAEIFGDERWPPKTETRLGRYLLTICWMFGLVERNPGALRAEARAQQAAADYEEYWINRLSVQRAWFVAAFVAPGFLEARRLEGLMQRSPVDIAQRGIVAVLAAVFKDRPAEPGSVIAPGQGSVALRQEQLDLLAETRAKRQLALMADVLREQHGIIDPQLAVRLIVWFRAVDVIYRQSEESHDWKKEDVSERLKNQRFFNFFIQSANYLDLSIWKDHVPQKWRSDDNKAFAFFVAATYGAPAIVSLVEPFLEAAGRIYPGVSSWQVVVRESDLHLSAQSLFSLIGKRHTQEGVFAMHLLREAGFSNALDNGNFLLAPAIAGRPSRAIVGLYQHYRLRALPPRHIPAFRSMARLEQAVATGWPQVDSETLLEPIALQVCQRPQALSRGLSILEDMVELGQLPGWPADAPSREEFRTRYGANLGQDSVPTGFELAVEPPEPISYFYDAPKKDLFGADRDSEYLGRMWQENKLHLRNRSQALDWLDSSAFSLPAVFGDIARLATMTKRDEYQATQEYLRTLIGSTDELNLRWADNYGRLERALTWIIEKLFAPSVQPYKPTKEIKGRLLEAANVLPGATEESYDTKRLRAYAFYNLYLSDRPKLLAKIDNFRDIGQEDRQIARAGLSSGTYTFDDLSIVLRRMADDRTLQGGFITHLGLAAKERSQRR